MKRLMIAASCLALVLPSMTLAQMSPGDNTKPAPGQGQRPDRPGGDGGANRPGRPGGDAGPNRPGRPGGGGSGGAGPNRPGNPNRPGILPINPPGNGYRPPHHRPPHHRPPNRPGILPIRPGQGWNGHRYRAGLFRYPTGYGYRRWSRGQILPILFLSAAYYFTNYAVLGLDPPPYGYQWVRYGPDVLLVNIRTGQIMDVEYNVFY